MKKKLVTTIQVLVGVALLAILLRVIDKTSVLVGFVTDGPVVIVDGATYAVGAVDGPRVVVRSTEAGGQRFWAVAAGDVKLIPEAGRLVRVDGQGPDGVAWRERSFKPYGLGMLADTFKMAGANWPYLVLGYLLFFVCVLATTWRWQMLLHAQGLMLTFPRSLLLFFVGHFFNSFMFGATGGDVVKAYYAAKETSHKKAEAVSTVFIDRVVGLLVVLLVMVVVMLVRLPFFMKFRMTQISLVYGAGLLVAFCGGMFVVLRKNLFEQYAFFRKLESRPGVMDIMTRVYSTTRICFTHPALLVKTCLLSFVNQFTYIVISYIFGRALHLDLGFGDYMTFIPIVSSVGCIPVTPGGIGTRDAAMVALMAVFGVANASSFTLSILLYSVILSWGLIGGVVYIFAAHKLGRVSQMDETA